MEQQPQAPLQPVIWLGRNTALLDAARRMVDIHHVYTPKTLLQALQHRLAGCVVLDLARDDFDLAPLLRQIRHTWPDVHIVGLVENATAPPDFSEVDQFLPYDTPDSVLQDVLHHLAAPPAPDDDQKQFRDYHQLQARTRHLEGLLQATFTISGAVAEGDILGDLREVARVAVDADDMAILIASPDYSDLSDALNLGVDEQYLAVCRDHLLALPPEGRELYLGDEVLLRERLPDMLRSAPRVREAEAAGAWSYMRLPLISEQQLIGVVALFSQTPGQFNGAHLQLGRLFAAQVSAAVRNMRLYWRLNRAEQHQRSISRVAYLIAEDLALDAVLARIVEEAVRLVQGELGMVLLVQPDQSLLVSAEYGSGSQDLVGYQVASGVGQAGQVALSGQPSVITDYPNWEGANDDLRDTVTPDAVLFAVPLVYRGRVLGVLQVIASDRESQSTREKLQILRVLAPQAATAIAKAQLHEIVRQDRQQLQAILDHTAAAVALCDQEGHVLMMNSESERLLEVLDISLDDVRVHPLPDLLQEWLDDVPPLAQTGNVIEVNLGAVGEYLLHIAPITKADGTIDRYVGVAQDVSDLRRLDRMKSDMIHILSHDLRNPLGLARGSIELLDEPDMSDQQRADLKAMIISSLDRMDQLIQDVVDLEMAGALGQETALPYKLPPLVQKVIRRNQDKAASQDIALRYHEQHLPPRRLRGHAVLVGQAIDNLVSNAIKYTPAGGHVDVTLSMEGEYVLVRVADDGYGIPGESIPYLFQQFYRVNDKRTRHIQGTGLGLSLVKTIAEAHGGHVTVHSEVDSGSVFKLYLPLNPRFEQAQSSTPIMRLDLSGLAKSLHSDLSSAD